jgi:hypothetical protein
VVTDAQDSKKSAGAIQSVYFPLPAVCAQHCSDYDRCSNDFALLQGAFVSNAVEQTWESASERISTYVISTTLPFPLCLAFTFLFSPLIVVGTVSENQKLLRFVSWCEKVLIEMEYEQLRGKHTLRATRARTGEYSSLLHASLASKLTTLSLRGMQKKGMSWLLSNNKYFAWFTYILAIIINILILVGYGHSDYRAPEVSTSSFSSTVAPLVRLLLTVPQVKWVTISLMIVHVASAGLILLVLFYTRAPSANAKRCESPALCQFTELCFDWVELIGRSLGRADRWADYLSTWSHLGVVQSMIGATGNRASRPRQQNMLKIKADRKKAIIAQLQQSRAAGFSWLLRMRYDRRSL